MSQSVSQSKFNRWRPGILAAVALALFGTAGVVEATTVLPMDVAELSDQAELVFTGTAVQSRVVLSGDGREPYTFVTFIVQDVLKGWTLGRQIALRFAGGEVGNGTVTLVGMPQFEQGQTYLLFVQGNGSLLCPVLGWWQGQFHFGRQPGSEKRVLLDSAGLPLQGIQQGRFQRQRAERASDDGGMTVLSEEGVHVVLPERTLDALSAKKAPPAEAPDAAQMIEQLRSFIAGRRTARTFRPGRMVESARMEDVPARAPDSAARQH